jgi:type II restriction enzyme
MNISDAKTRLDLIIGKSRVDMYKPMQVAETLFYSRNGTDINFDDIDSYKNLSCRWRDVVSIRLLGKRSTSSAQFQHNIWNANAFPPEVMKALDAENKANGGVVENYIYNQLSERLATVTSIIQYIRESTTESFDLTHLLSLFVSVSGLRRSIDKAYEIVTHGLFETIVVALEAQVTVSVPEKKIGLLEEFEDLAKILLGVDSKTTSFSRPAHIYRVGVTNAADRGLDMWANFGPAVQVKHLTLDGSLASQIVDQVESDQIVVVCRKCEADVIKIVAKQIGWGRRVMGIVTEAELTDWYEKCLRGKYATELGTTLLRNLLSGFEAEFTQDSEVAGFLLDRGYNTPRGGIWA